jgi:hypothetical protein
MGAGLGHLALGLPARACAFLGPARRKPRQVRKGKARASVKQEPTEATCSGQTPAMAAITAARLGLIDLRSCACRV